MSGLFTTIPQAKKALPHFDKLSAGSGTKALRKSSSGEIVMRLCFAILRQAQDGRRHKGTVKNKINHGRTINIQINLNQLLTLNTEPKTPNSKLRTQNYSLRHDLIFACKLCIDRITQAVS
jgi:hypothetical protein